MWHSQYATPQSALQLTHHSDPGEIIGESRHSQYAAPQSALRLVHHGGPGEFGGMKKRRACSCCGRALLVDRLARCYLVAFSAFMVMVWKRCSIQASG